MNNTISMLNGDMTNNQESIDFFSQDGIPIRVASALSIIGSTYIIQDVLRDLGKWKESVYHRIMLGLSTVDVLSSLFLLFLQGWPLPKELGPFAFGTMYTCDATGFIGNIGMIGTPLYNCTLATYFLVQLKYHWSKPRIEAAEKWFHIVPWTVAIVTSVAGLAANTFGPFFGTCWVTEAYPIGCGEPGSLVKCSRGGNGAFAYFWGFLILCLVFTILFVSITMFLVYKSVWTIENEAVRYSFARYSARRINHYEMSRRIKIQGILYALALLSTYIGLILFFVIWSITGHQSMIFFFVVRIIFPLQGFFNMLIYLIPVYVRIYKKHKQRRREVEEQVLREIEPEESSGENLGLSLEENSEEETKEEITPLSLDEPHVRKSVRIKDEREGNDIETNGGRLQLNQISSCQ